MKLVSVSEIAEQIRGVTYGKSDVVDRPSDGFLPVLRANNITDQGLMLDDFVYVRADKISERQKIRAGDIVIAASSGSISVVGKAAQAIDNLNAGFGAFCKVVRPSKNIFPRYLGHYFKTSEYRRKMSALAGGANINNLKNEHIDTLVLPLPSLDQQKRIASILDQADDLRRKRQRTIDRLNQLSQAIFYEMFGDPVTNHMKWDKVSLIDCCSESDDIRCGPFGTQLLKEEFQDSGVPLWGIKQVNKGFSIPTHEYVTERKAKVLSNYNIVENDIVMTRKGTIGNCAVYPSSFKPGIMHSDLLRVRLNPKKAVPQFVADQLHFSRDVEWQIDLISGGAIMKGINVGKLKKIKVVLPPFSLQNEYMKKIDLVISQSSVMKRSLKESEIFFLALQHRAFKGEL